MENKLNYTPSNVQIESSGLQPPILEEDSDFDSVLLAHMEDFDQKQHTSTHKISQSPSAPEPSSLHYTPCTTPPRHSLAVPISPIPFNFPSSQDSQESPSSKHTKPLSPQLSSTQPVSLAFTPKRGKYAF
jgi:hypothetical protein